MPLLGQFQTSYKDGCIITCFRKKWKEGQYMHCLRLLYISRYVSRPSEVIPKPLYQIKANRAAYQDIPRIFFTHQ